MTRRTYYEDLKHLARQKRAEFCVNTAGVLGEQYIAVQPGSWDRPPLAPGAIVRGVDPPRIDLIVARAYEFLDDITQLLRDGIGTVHGPRHGRGGDAGNAGDVAKSDIAGRCRWIGPRHCSKPCCRP